MYCLYSRAYYIIEMKHVWVWKHLKTQQHVRHVVSQVDVISGWGSYNFLCLHEKYLVICFMTKEMHRKIYDNCQACFFQLCWLWWVGLSLAEKAAGPFRRSYTFVSSGLSYCNQLYGVNDGLLKKLQMVYSTTAPVVTGVGPGSSITLHCYCWTSVSLCLSKDISSGSDYHLFLSLATVVHSARVLLGDTMKLSNLQTFEPSWRHCVGMWTLSNVR